MTVERGIYIRFKIEIVDAKRPSGDEEEVGEEKGPSAEVIANILLPDCMTRGTSAERELNLSDCFSEQPGDEIYDWAMDVECNYDPALMDDDGENYQEYEFDVVVGPDWAE